MQQITQMLSKYGLYLFMAGLIIGASVAHTQQLEKNRKEKAILVK